MKPEHKDCGRKCDCFKRGLAEGKESFVTSFVFGRVGQGSEDYHVNRDNRPVYPMARLKSIRLDLSKFRIDQASWGREPRVDISSYVFRKRSYEA